MSGQSSVLEKLTPGLSGGLSTEAVEWKRSYGRATKIVNLDADFLPLDPNRVQLNSRHLRDIPVLHTFWIECPVRTLYMPEAKMSKVCQLQAVALTGALNEFWAPVKKIKYTG